MTNSLSLLYNQHMVAPIRIFFDEIFLAHETGAHPERKERLKAILGKLKQLKLDGYLAPVKKEVEVATSLQQIHRPEYLEKLQKLQVTSPTYLDPDTLVSSRSVEAAVCACTAVAQAVQEVAESKTLAAFCLVRPPGHHAEAARAMGFCLFNNVAVGAMYALQKLGLSRVAIIDWDVHHGNGTQKAFYKDPRVLFASIHQYPLYPGTGWLDERGEGKGLGTTLNFPLEAASTLSDYQMVFEEVLIPRLLDLKPQLLLISAGYDAHDRDPLAGMRLSSKAYEYLAGYLFGVAKQLKAGLVAVLEGGYDLDALALSVAFTIQGFGKNLDLNDPFSVHPKPIRSRTKEVVSFHREK